MTYGTLSGYFLAFIGQKSPFFLIDFRKWLWKIGGRAILGWQMSRDSMQFHQNVTFHRVESVI
jgi:hypothetical protein